MDNHFPRQVKIKQPQPPVVAVSPYSDAIAKCAEQLIYQFRSLLVLPEWFRSDIGPNERVGVLSFGSLDKASQVYAGMQKMRYSFDGLLIVSSPDDGLSESQITFARELTNIEHWFGLVHSMLDHNGILYNISSDRPIEATYRQSLTDPHYWIADIVFSGAMEFAIQTGLYGEHITNENL